MSSSIRLTIIKTKTAKIVAMQEIVITLLLIAAVAAIFLLSSGTSEHETEWSFLDSKFSAFATNNTSSIRGNESIRIDNDDNNNIPFYNSSHINSPYIKEYSMPKGTWPNGILVDKKGIVWTVGTKSQTLISFDPKQGRIVSEYPIKNNGYETTELLKASSSQSLPSRQRTTIPMMTWAIVEDNNDGSIWFSQADSPNPLWRFDPLTKRFEVIENITGAPYQMKVDNKTGDIWFTTYTDNKIGVIQKVEGKQMTPTFSSSFDNNINNNSSNNNTPHYSVKEFGLDRQAFPTGLYLDGQDSIWIAQSLNDKLVHFKAVRDNNGKVIDLVKVLEIPSNSFSSLSPSSVISSSSDKMKKLFAGPYDIVVHGADVWVTEHDANFITRYNNNSNYSPALVTKFPTSSNPHQYLSLPFWLRETQDDHGLWFNEHYGNRIAFFNITDTTLTEYEVPTRNQSLGYIGNALNFAVDPADSNNKVWFSEYNHDKIGVVDRNISIPFDIHSFTNKTIILSESMTNTTKVGEQHLRQKDKTTFVNFEISKSKKVENEINNTNSNSLPQSNDKGYATIFFKTSSSMTDFGLLNVTPSFSTDSIDLAKIKDGSKIPVQLILQNDFKVNPGNYSLGISATDGRVTKSIFLDLVLK